MNLYPFGVTRGFLWNKVIIDGTHLYSSEIHPPRRTFVFKKYGPRYAKH